MKFTESLWVSIADIYNKILKHSFIRELTDGSLDEKAFRFYLIQDALYLKEYARRLALLGAKAPQDQWLIMTRNIWFSGCPASGPYRQGPQLQLIVQARRGLWEPFRPRTEECGHFSPLSEIFSIFLISFLSFKMKLLEI